MTINELLEAYAEKQSVRAAAKAAGCSWQRAIKILSSNGVVANDTHALILKLHEKGDDLKKIAGQTGLSSKVIQAYLPAVRPIYKINPSKNAQRIKTCRMKKIEKK